jgi:outer membrane protein assembly factor BamB
VTHRIGLRQIVLAAVGLAVAAGSAPLCGTGVNWPQWRGPSGQGISTETGLPTFWSPTERIAWKTPIPGRGHSSPIVWDDRVFLSTAIEGEIVPGHATARHIIEGQPYIHPDSVNGDRRHTLKVIALETDTGKVLWERTAYDGPMFDGRHRRGSFASATPVTDGIGVFVFFGAEGAYAYEMDGRPRWKADVGRIKTIGLGTASSPVLYRDLLILQCDDDEGTDSFMVALDKRTGREAWRVRRPVQVSWSSPVLLQTATRSELVTNGSEFVVGYDPATGRELWRVKGVESNAIHTPLVGNGLVIATAGFPNKRVIAIRPGGSGDVTATHVVWRYEKGTAYVASPILYDGLVYLLTDGGIITCLDAQTGIVKYEGGRPPKPGKFISSPVAFDGKLLLTSDTGDTFVIKAGPVFSVIGTNNVGEGVNASLALANGRIYIRGDEHLYCIRG